MTSLLKRSGWLIAFALVACGRKEPGNDPRTAGNAEVPSPSAEAVASGRGVARTAINDRRAEAKFESVASTKLSGEAKLEETASGVLIHVNVADGPPGTKGIHIHEKGDCSNIEGMSMGSHFNPGHVAHGLPSSSQHHPGDLGNIVIQENGKGSLEITTEQGGLKPDEPTSFIGRAIVIHESDDKGAQPTGNAGKPIACAVIKAS